MFFLSHLGHQSGFCMICIMQNHIIQAFANTGNAIKPVSFIRDLKSKMLCAALGQVHVLEAVVVMWLQESTIHLHDSTLSGSV